MKRKSMGNKYIVPVISSIILLVLAGVALYRWIGYARKATNEAIVKDMAMLKENFEKIDQACGIIGFEHDRNYIDFLTVKSFSGSQVGSMNLKYSDRWQGPYQEAHPMVQGKLYEVIKNQAGYLIVPGNGVELANGKIMGKDIVINYDTDIDALMNEEVGLVYKGQPLVERLQIKRGLEMLDVMSDYNPEM